MGILARMFATPEVLKESITAVKDGLDALSAALLVNTDLVRIGGDVIGTDDTYLKGWTEELRVTKAARYAANFTTPTAAFPNS